MNDEPTNALPLNDTGGSSRGRAMSEGWLWCHALGLLNPSEEQTVRKTAALDESAAATLIEIQRSLGLLPGEDRASSGTVADHVQQAVTDALQQFGALAGAAAAVAVRLRDGFTVGFLEPAWRQLRAEPIALGTRGLAQPSASDPSPHVRLETGDGTRISLLAGSQTGFDIFVEVGNAPASGVVELFRLEAKAGRISEESTGIACRIERGLARLVNCPEGALKIFLPDGRHYLLIVTSQRTDASAADNPHDRDT